MARTDARHDHGLDEAIDRARRFHELGADILFVEAPRDKDEMRRICEELPGPKMANMIEGGLTPILSPEELQQMGFQIAAYPITLIAAAMKAMTTVLAELKTGKVAPENLMPFDEVKTRIGFDDYFETEKHYGNNK
jgi:2-methylisocitrate lyase-like PEP mutase family enzyme